MVIDETTAYHHTTTGPAIRSVPLLVRVLFRIRLSWFQLFSVDALQNQIYGNERLEAQHFKDHLCYGEDVDEVMKCHFVRYLDNANEGVLRDLLRFMTGTENFRTGKEGGWLTINQVDAGRMPFAQTCFRSLDLPGERDWSIFRDKLEQAVRQGVMAHGAFHAE